MNYLWDYDEKNEMEELEQKLVLTTMELDKLKAEKTNEMRKNNEYVNELIKLVKCVIHQRDEAINQLQNVLNTQIVVPHSSMSESSSLPEPYTCRPIGSPNINLVVNQPLVQNSNANSLLKVDQGSLIIDTIAKKCVLPQKGKLLQAVIEAGPLLQTLRLAGPLPTWRNPPQLQSFQIPAVSINGCDAEKKPGLNVGRWITRSVNSSCGSAKVSNYGNGSMLSSGIVNDNGCFRLAKRQRFC